MAASVVNLKRTRKAKPLPPGYAFRAFFSTNRVVRPSSTSSTSPKPASESHDKSSAAEPSSSDGQEPSWHEVVGEVRDWAAQCAAKPLAIVNPEEEAFMFLQYIHGKYLICFLIIYLLCTVDSLLFAGPLEACQPLADLLKAREFDEIEQKLCSLWMGRESQGAPGSWKANKAEICAAISRYESELEEDRQPVSDFVEFLLSECPGADRLSKHLIDLLKEQNFVGAVKYLERSWDAPQAPSRAFNQEWLKMYP